MNVRTGRKGYYRRVQATDKAVEQTAEVFNGDIELGDNDADRHFTLAKKECLSTTEAVDVGELMFFQSSQITPRHSGSASWRTEEQDPLPIADGSHRNNAPVKREYGDVDSDDEEGSEDQSRQSSSAFKGLSFALPKAKCVSLAKAEAKAKAFAKAKSRAVVQKDSAASTKAKGRGTKRKAAETEEGETASVRILQLDQPEMQQPKDGETISLDSADQQVVDEYFKKVNEKRLGIFKTIVDGDAATNDGLKSGLKELSALLAQLKSKMKSLKRRNNKDSTLLQEKLDEFSKEISDAISLSSGLIALSGDDREHLDTMVRMSSIGWRFGDAVYKRAFKCAMLSHLKFEQWHMVTSGTRDSMIHQLGPSSGAEFFNVLVNDMVQRLLRSVALNKASVLFVAIERLKEFDLKGCKLVRLHNLSLR